MADPSGQLIPLLERFTGQRAPLQSSAVIRGEALLSAIGLGHSQLNEVLLLLGYDRVTQAFFQYIADGTCDCADDSSIKSMDQLREGIDRFIKHAMLRYGNIKHAFKHLSSLDVDEMTDEISLAEPRDDATFNSRHDAVYPVEEISGQDTYYLGYIIKKELDALLEANPNNDEVRRELEKRDEIVARGKRNYQAYLASDHMDVYVATSMRERHEFYIANAISSKVFSDERLRDLKLRWFDPTQAYCHDRMDKGVSEALMLKRAHCTLYLAQEADTLGKDSELASTLAQGKPVIAFVPRIIEKEEDRYVKWLSSTARRLYPDRPMVDIVSEQLQLFAPELAWKDPIIRKWLNDPTSMELEQAQRILARKIREHYDRRANTLQEIHPLAMQVHLESGVANGVLVARTTDQCAELIYRIITNRLEFDIEEKDIDGKEYLLLREKESRSVFRFVSGDAMLTNAFWNFYLD